MWVCPVLLWGLISLRFSLSLWGLISPVFSFGWFVSMSISIPASRIATMLSQLGPKKDKPKKGEEIWVFPKIGVFPPKSSHFNRVFHYKPSILGYPLFLETSISDHSLKVFKGTCPFLPGFIQNVTSSTKNAHLLDVLRDDGIFSATSWSGFLFSQELSGIGQVLSTGRLLQQCAFGGAIDMNISSMQCFNKPNDLELKITNTFWFHDFFMPISSFFLTFFIDIYGSFMILGHIFGRIQGLQPDVEWERSNSGVKRNGGFGVCFVGRWLIVPWIVEAVGWIRWIRLGLGSASWKGFYSTPTKICVDSSPRISHILWGRCFGVRIVLEN